MRLSREEYICVDFPIDKLISRCYYDNTINLQGGVQFPTGGIAHEPYEVDSVKFRSRRSQSGRKKRKYMLICIFACRFYFCRLFILKENEL